MTENEKQFDSAEEAVNNAPETEVNTGKETVDPAAESAAATEEVKEEPVEVKEEVKVAPAKKEKSGKKKVWLIPVIVVAVLAVACLVMTFVMDSLAVSAYNKGATAKKAEVRQEAFEDAYSKSRFALFQSKDKKNQIIKVYIDEVLCAKGEFYKAGNILESSSMSDADKEKLLASHGELGMIKAGNVVTFGKYETDGNSANNVEDLEWIVLDVVKENGFVRALVMTKDVVGSPQGFNRYDNGNTVYADSQLYKWCNETFFNGFTMNTDGIRSEILKMKIEVTASSDGTSGGDAVEAYAYAPSKEEVQKYLTGDLEQYLIASATAQAKKEGVITYGAAKAANYLLRNPGIKENGTQWTAGISNEGKLVETFSATGADVGARVCMNVNLGND